MYYLPDDSLTSAAIVVTIERKNKVLKSYQFACKRVDNNKGGWNLLTFNADLQGFGEDSELKIYLFNNQGKVYLDEMNIYLSNSFF